MVILFSYIIYIYYIYNYIHYIYKHYISVGSSVNYLGYMGSAVVQQKLGTFDLEDSPLQKEACVYMVIEGVILEPQWEWELN